MTDFKSMSDEELLKAISAMRKHKEKEDYKSYKELYGDPGVVGTIAIGAGRALDKGAKGLEQMFQGVRSAFGSESAANRLKEMKQEEEGNDHFYRGLSEDRPVSTFVGEAAPYLAIPAARTLQGAVAMGAAPGLISYGTPQEKAVSAAGGAIGGAGGKFIGDKLASKGAEKLTMNAEAAKDIAERVIDMATMRSMGMKPTVGTATQWRPAQLAESVLPNLVGGGAVTDVIKHNRKMLDTKVASMIGESADNLDDAVRAAAKSRLGSQWDEMAKKGPVYLGNEFKKEVGDQLAKLQNASPELRSDAAEGLLQSYLERARNQGVISAKTYTADRSLIGKKIPGAEGDVQHSYSVLQDALDTARGASFKDAGDAAKWAAMRDQYGILKTIEDMAARNPDGSISPKMLLNRVTQKHKEGEIRDVAKIASKYIADKVPDSGTAQRGLMSAGLIGGGAAVGIDPITATLTPWLASKALTSDLGVSSAMALQKGLNQAQRKLTEKEIALLRQGGLLGGATGTVLSRRRDQATK